VNAFDDLSQVRGDCVPEAPWEPRQGSGGDPYASLDPFTVSALQRHLAMLDRERRAFGPRYAGSGPLFCKPDGRALHPDTITRRFNRLVDAAGVRRIRLHDVRHTYATASLDAGINSKQISDRIGYANVAFTLTTYTHRSTGEDRPAADAFARLFFPGSQRAEIAPEDSDERDVST
jgi:integrase